MGWFAEQHTIGLILDYDPIALVSVLSKHELGLNLDNDTSDLNTELNSDSWLTLTLTLLEKVFSWGTPMVSNIFELRPQTDQKISEIDIENLVLL